jgi:hypothetical protein
MHARMTRYEGAPPQAFEESLQTKKGVLPTEFGQTEGKGAIFLADRQGGTVIVISLSPASLSSISQPKRSAAGDAGQRGGRHARARGGHRSR